MTEEKPKKERQEKTQGTRWWRRFAKNLGGAPRTREDLLEFLREAAQNQLLDADAMAMFMGILGTTETQVREVMVPRAQVVTLGRDWMLDRILPTVVDSRHSRFPVTGESKDEIVGIVLAKDLLKFSAGVAGFDPGTFDMQRLLRPVQFVPESKRLNVLLKEFKRARSHMAIVVDEYGGLAGVVTIEDVLEEIVGEIPDEMDEAESARILKQDERRYLVNALATVDEFNAYFHTQIDGEEFDTIGGLVMHRFGHLPKRGESIRIDALNFNVQRADSRRVHQFLVTVSPS
jgi:magnesium and cobalt transporter